MGYSGSVVILLIVLRYLLTDLSNDLKELTVYAQ